MISSRRWVFPILAAALVLAHDSVRADEAGGTPTDRAVVAETEVPSDTGRVTGRVVYRGRVARSWKAPEEVWTPPETSMEAEPDPSGAPSPPAIQITETGGLRDAAIWLDSDEARKSVRGMEFEPVEIDQKGSVFFPQMVVLPRGGTLKLKNSDGINHNVHLLSHRQEKNFLLRSQDEREVRLNHNDAIRVTCDLHAWMRSSLVIVETPFFAVSDAEGHFTIGKVPPGVYTISIGHHRFTSEPENIQVEVRAGEETEIEIPTGLSRWDH
jgi:plastocyanin